MPFDEVAFERAAWRPRSKTFPAPEALHGFFSKGDKKEFRVRGLVGREAARMRNEGESVDRLTELAAKFRGSDSAEIAEAIVERLGTDPKLTPDEVFKHMLALEIGLEYPKISRPTLFRLYDYHHGFMQLLIGAILELSTSAEPGKRRDSGRTGASEST